MWTVRLALRRSYTFTVLANLIGLPEYPERNFQAHVVRTAGALASHTLLTELEDPNHDGALFPGMYPTDKSSLAKPAKP